MLRWLLAILAVCEFSNYYGTASYQISPYYSQEGISNDLSYNGPYEPILPPQWLEPFPTHYPPIPPYPGQPIPPYSGQPIPPYPGQPLPLYPEPCNGCISPFLPLPYPPQYPPMPPYPGLSPPPDPNQPLPPILPNPKQTCNGCIPPTWLDPHPTHYPPIPPYPGHPLPPYPGLPPPPDPNQPLPPILPNPELLPCNGCMPPDMLEIPPYPEQPLPPYPGLPSPPDPNQPLPPIPPYPGLPSPPDPNQPLLPIPPYPGKPLPSYPGLPSPLDPNQPLPPILPYPTPAPQQPPFPPESTRYPRPPKPSKEPRPPQSCKKEYRVVKKLHTWHSAVEQCKRMGKSLVSIHNKKEWRDIKRVISRAGPPMNYWTSGSNLGHTMFLWTSTWEPFTFTDWDVGEPNNWGGNQHCTFIKAHSLKWDDWDCDGLHYFICEKCA